MPNKYNSMIAKIQQAGREVVENDLIKDDDWIESAKKVYKMDNGKDFKGSPQEAVQYGLDRMASFNYNISGSHIPGQGKHGGTVPDAVNIHKQDDDTKIAFAYLMDTYDDKDVSWEGVKRFASETATDLTNYIGFGAGLGAKFVVRNTAKTALRRQLIDGISKKLSTQTGVMTSAATLGAGYAGGFNVAEQEVKTQAGLQKKINPKEAITHTAIGAVAGPTIVKGVQVAGKGIGKGIDYVRKQGEEAMAQAAGGGTPPNYVDIKPNTKDTIKLYRGTSETGTGGGESLVGKGLYLTPNVDTAKKYGSKIEEVEIKNENLYDATSTMTDKEYKEFVRLFRGERGIEYMPDKNIGYTYEFLKDDIGANTGLDYEEVAEKMNTLIKKKGFEGMMFDLSRVTDSTQEGEKAFLLFKKETK